MEKKIKIILWLCGWLFWTLTACAPSQSSQPLAASPTVSPTATVLPASQAVDLGILGKGSAYDTAWSADGKLLAVMSWIGVYLYDTQTWDVVKTIRKDLFRDKSFDSVAFSFDQKSLIMPVSDHTTSTFWRYDLQTDQVTPWFEALTLKPQTTPVFSPDKKTFAFLNQVCEKIAAGRQNCADNLELRESDTGKLLISIPTSDLEWGMRDRFFVFSPSGKQLAAANQPNHITLWDIATGKQLFEFVHDSAVASLAFSPDGKVLASASQDATTRFWDTKTGKNLFILRGFKRGLQIVVYLEHGKKLLVGQSDDNTFQEYALDDQYLPSGPIDTTININENDVSVSPDTHKMAVLLNGTVQIWDLDQSKIILSLPEYNGSISTWAFSPDASLLAVADRDIYLWAIPAQKWLAKLPMNAHEIQAAAFSPDGKNLVVSAEGGLTFWDTTTFQKLREIKTEYGVDILAYAPDGKRLAIAGSKYIQILDAESGLAVQRFSVESDVSLAINFSADGKQLFYIGNLNRWSWDLAAGQILYSIQTKPSYDDRAALSPNLALVRHGYTQASDPQQNYSLRFFDPVTGQNLYDFAHEDELPIVALSLDGRLLARYRNEKIDLLDAASGQVFSSLDFSNLSRLALSPNSRILAATSFGGSLHLWDISSIWQRAKAVIPLTATPAPTPVPTPSATPVVVLPISFQAQMPPSVDADAIRTENITQLKKLNEFGLGRVNIVAWAPDRKSLALGGYPGVHIFAMGSSRPTVSLPADGDIVGLAYSPDGHLLAGQISNYAIQVWDVPAGRSLYTLDKRYCWKAELSFTSDNQVLSAQCGSVTYRWNALDGRLLDKTEGASLPDGLASPDGSLRYQASGDIDRLVEAESGQIIQSFEITGMTPGPVAFSPDGKTLMIWYRQFEIGEPGTGYPGKDHESVIQLWNLTPGAVPSLRASLPAGKWDHTDAQFRLAGFQVFSFSADSRRLATASGDGSIRVWSTQSGELLYRLSGGEQVYFSPDDKQLVSLGNVVQVWDVSAGKTPAIPWSLTGFTEFRDLLAVTGKDDQFVTASLGEFRFWSRNGTELPTSIKTAGSDAHSPAISPEGKWLAYGTDTNLLLGENKPIPNWRSSETFSGVHTVIFSPNSLLLAAADTDRKIMLWRLGQADAKPSVLTSNIYVDSLIFSPDSKLLLVTDGASYMLSDISTTLSLWEVETGTLLRTWKTKAYQFVFHPTGAALAASDYTSGEITLFDLRNWQPLQNMTGQKNVIESAFSPDGSLLVTSGKTGLEFWDMNTGKLVKTITGDFEQLIFSPDGKVLVTSLNDGRIQVWGLAIK